MSPPSIVATIAAAAFAALGSLPALAQPAAWEAGPDALKPVPALSARVTDLTSTLSAAERASLESKLAAFEQATGAQMAVLLVPTTLPEPVEAYAIRVADAWKIGRKGRDDGVLLVVAKDDRRLRLEVGYGLEGAIPDAVAKRIVAEDVAPRFREGRYADGIDAAADRVIAIVGKGEAPPPQRASRGPRGLSLETIALLALVVVPAVGGILKTIFGKLGGATVGAGIAGGITWLVLGSLALAIGAAVIAWIAILLIGGVGGVGGASGRRGGGVWLPGGGGWGGGGMGGGSGGGGWSGGGGGFGGGGASGGW